MDLWDLQTGRLLYSLPDEEGTLWWLAWSPDSQRLAVSRSNGDIAIWNLKEVERVLAKLGLDAGETVPRTVPVRSTNGDARDLNPPSRCSDRKTADGSRLSAVRIPRPPPRNFARSVGEILCNLSPFSPV